MDTNVCTWCEEQEATHHAYDEHNGEVSWCDECWTERDEQDAA